MKMVSSGVFQLYLFVGVMLVMVTFGNGSRQEELVLPPPSHAYWDGHEYPRGHRNFGLSVPFYLYSGGGFDAFTGSCGLDFQFTKSMEVSWLNRLARHPWRVTDPDDAVVFVVPGLFAVPVALTGTQEQCTRPLDEMSDELLSALQASPHYHKNNARDHVLVVGYFKAERYVSNSTTGWAKALARMTVAPHVIGKTVEPLVAAGSCLVPVGHQAQPPPPPPPVKEAATSITHTLFFLGQAVGTGFYRTRRALFAPGALRDAGRDNYVVATQCKGHGQKDEPFPECGSAAAKLLKSTGPHEGCCIKRPLPYEEYIKLFSSSNFSLSIRGGDAGSSRAFDAVAMGVPQIAIADEFFTKYAPFQCTVPWRDFVYHVESEDAVLQDAHKVMRKAVAEALPRREQMKKMQDSFMDDLLWTSPGSLAANNLLVEVAKRCLPLSRHHASSMYRKARAAIDAHECVLTPPPSEAELAHDEQRAHFGPMTNRARRQGGGGRGEQIAHFGSMTNGTKRRGAG